jgi:hypothetical protein
LVLIESILGEQRVGFAMTEISGGRADEFGDFMTVLKLRIPAKPITDSDLMAVTVPSDAEHRRSEATLSSSYHAEVIGIRQPFLC